LRSRVVFVAVAAVLALFAAMALGVAFGSGPAGLRDLFASGTPAHAIVAGYRLPRVLLGAVAGAGLAAVGASFQSVLRNPLADPYILGVSGGAALGATLAIALGGGAASVLAAAGVPAASFAGGAAATALVYVVGRAAPDRPTDAGTGASILLAGVVINAIAHACILFIEALAAPDKLQSLVWWLMGYLDAPSWPRLAFVSLYTAAGLVLLLADAARINVLSLGDEEAYSLGIDVRALERRSLVACAAVVGAVVSVAGPIGFVGLVVPQALRRALGPDLRVLLPASIAVGATTLVLCDLVVRVAAPVVHTEVPVGAVTALVGGPVFLALLAGGRAWRRGR
jgi:iron complex transport system permease protein